MRGVANIESDKQVVNFKLIIILEMALNSTIYFIFISNRSHNR